MGEWASLFIMLSLSWWKHHKKRGAPGYMWDLFVLVSGTAFAAVSQPAVPAVPGHNIQATQGTQVTQWP